MGLAADALVAESALILVANEHRYSSVRPLKKQAAKC
jgi:hypothetical protein